MSGGSFDYAYSSVSRFADDLRNKLDEQGKPNGEGWTQPEWTPDVSAKLAEIAALAERVSKLMKEAEWLYSGDTGEDTFMRRVTEFEGDCPERKP